MGIEELGIEELGIEELGIEELGIEELRNWGLGIGKGNDLQVGTRNGFIRKETIGHAFLEKNQYITAFLAADYWIVLIEFEINPCNLRNLWLLNFCLNCVVLAYKIYQQ